MNKWASREHCVVHGILPAEYHHILTRGARPDLQNEDWNKISLCRTCHSYIHSQGTIKTAIKHAAIKAWLVSNGWDYDDYLRKWKHPKASRVKT